MSRILHCTLCDAWIEMWGADEFNYTEDGSGPYCEKCWVWQKQIDELKVRLAELENQPVTEAQLRGALNKQMTKRQSPYDCGKKRP